MSRSTVRSALVVALLVGSLAACADESTPAATDPTSTAATTTPAPTTAPAPTTTSPEAEPTPGQSATNGTTVLTSPVDGAVVTGPSVAITGEATAFEGNLSWVVYAEGGSLEEPSQEGSTMTGANGEVGPFETTVDLEPGTWTVAVFESSAMDGQPLNLVSATITVK
ncbi:hypothetical protein HF995_07235 [Sanguibacter hominis ATCC BAA-789]|uniref:Bacterial spore germination immunoglobulin-like domain-containing protein n=1 Tax=Sanguibacter hominis ATCC BAA-789 TaxID=1312740 RepID=A0A9X5FJ64_9MICO|nr:Gmad2 immunoglobulin-like domain-containing protein [Sanguibacter hominis]NKX93068.1 hypothetical protein [Sanguibacter hominis ATCC BAA-789]